MKIEIVQSISLPESLNEPINHNAMDKRIGVTRRNFIKLAGLGLLMSSLPSCRTWHPYSYPYPHLYRNAYYPIGVIQPRPYVQQFYPISGAPAPCYCDVRPFRDMGCVTNSYLVATIDQLLLDQTRWNVNQPTSGMVYIRNDNYAPAQGNFGLVVINQRSLDNDAFDVESQQEMPIINVPARKVITCKFKGGPKCQVPGDKQMVAVTKEDAKSQSFCV